MAFAFESQPWWQAVKGFFVGVPDYIPAVIVQEESSGLPTARGDFHAGYDAQGRPTFTQNPKDGPATSWGLFQLHGSSEQGNSFLGQGTGTPQAVMLQPVANARIAAASIVPAYKQALAQQLPAGYASTVASAIGATPDQGFLVLARTAELSGHTIPLPALWRSYTAYTGSKGAPGPDGSTGPVRGGYDPPGAPPAWQDAAGPIGGRGLERALLQAATPTPPPGALDIGGAIQRTGSKFTVGLFGILVAVIVIVAGVLAWKGKAIAQAAMTAA